MRGTVKLDPSVEEACRLRRQRLITNQQMIDAIMGKPYEVRGPQFHAYIRVSSEEQIEGASLDVQREQAELKYKMMHLANAELGWGGFYSDEGYSAYKMKFLDRPEGNRLNDNLRAGDVIAVNRFDRSFRSTEDFLECWRLWDAKGVRLLSVNEDLDLSSHYGKALVTILVTFAELDSAIKSERTKAGLASLRRRKIRTNAHPPIGYMFVKAHGRTHIVGDPKQLRFIPLIVELHEVQGLTWRAISDHIEGVMAAEEGRRPYGTISTPHRLWSAWRCLKAYQRRAELLELWREVQAEDEG